MKNIIIPDASVILKWVFNSPEEINRDKALLLLEQWLNGDIEILLPGLWVFEVGNIVGLKSPDIAEDIMKILIDYRFSEVTVSNDICKETFNLMKNYGVTFYDGVYHAVAIINRGIFVTADEKYCKKLQTLKNVIPLDKYGLYSNRDV
ncbi:MAG: type II toxin-antitoxin system VapC family toxin [Candidatus Eremiobacterota bacterium]